MDKFEIELKHPIKTLDELSLIYTPGVGYSCMEIKNKIDNVNILTNRLNSLAVIFDCKNQPEPYLIKAQAICSIIKHLVNIDAYAFVAKSIDVNFLIENLSPSFGSFYVFSNNSIKDFQDIFCIKRDFEFFDFEEIVSDAKYFQNSIETKKITNDIQFCDSDNFKNEALLLRSNLSGVIKTKDLCKNYTISELEDEFSVENIQNQMKLIKNDLSLAYEITQKKNTIAIISDGSATLGFGNTGAECALPVMEGKAAIFKEMGDVNAVPICLKTQNIDEILDICEAISPSFGGINLEDINAPRCFEIEEKLIKRTNIPIFHDDQHGTAIIVLAGLLSALELVNKKIEDVKIVFSGAGAAAQAVARLMLKAGAKNIIMSDINGIVSKNRKNNDIYLEKIANITNINEQTGDLSVAINNADVLIGLSKGNLVNGDMIKSMNKDAIVFALANPVPEINPNVALENGAKIVATGRSDFSNQINNSLAFPGIFKGVLNKKIKLIDDNLKLKAAFALHKYAKQTGISYTKLLPKALDKNVVKTIASACF